MHSTYKTIGVVWDFTGNNTSVEQEIAYFLKTIHNCEIVFTSPDTFSYWIDPSRTSNYGH